MANVLHADGFQTVARHQDNILTSLSRRLEVARATNNSRLIELLEQERQQVIASDLTPDQAPALTARLEGLKQRVVDFLAHRSELQVSQFVNGSDHWWYAFDPQTGEAVYADSEAELRLWIKENYRGR